jgi:hypothetical protein
VSLVATNGAKRRPVSPERHGNRTAGTLVKRLNIPITEEQSRQVDELARTMQLGGRSAVVRHAIYRLYCEEKNR